MAKIKVLFTTCTIMEAIDEVNIMLESAGSKVRVTENNIVNAEKVKHIEDWFDDYMFFFETEVPSNELDSLTKAGLDYEVIS